jgi:ATP-binding cassette, subfamily C (CFTR/MRP), member 1
MQGIVDTEFKHCTVLAVMHRLKHVDKYDKVALMHEGQLIEYDDPALLLAGETKFSDLYKSGGRW